MPFVGTPSEALDLAETFAGRGETIDATWICAKVAAQELEPAVALRAAALSRRLGDPATAVDGLWRLLRRIGPHQAILHNLGNALLATGAARKARRALTTAAALAPGDPDTLYSLGLVRLTEGDWRAGFALYEQRLSRREFNTPAPLTRADLDNLSGMRILLVDEQGYGDCLHFARFIGSLAARGAEVTLRARFVLRRLMEGCAGIDQVIARKASGQDRTALIGSLPAILGADPGAVPGAEGYIARPPPDPRLAAFDRPRVGLCWAGAPGNPRDRVRSLPARDLSALLAPVLDVSGVRFIGLQHGATAGLLDATRVPPLGADTADLHATAALIAGLDLVITIDSAIAHLAGALGKEAWVMLGTDVDWRWGLAGDGTPWYRHARLFRQDRPGNWAGVTARLAEALRARFG